MEKSSKITLKIKNDSETRRISVDCSIEWKGLKQKITSLFPQLEDITINYKDEEDDIITMDSQEEWEEALNQHESGKILRLFVNKKQISSQEKQQQQEQEESSPKCWWKRRRGCANKGSSVGCPRKHGGFFGGMRSHPHPHPHPHPHGGFGGFRGGRCGRRFRFWKLHYRAMSLMDSTKQEDLLEAKNLLEEMLKFIPCHTTTIYNLACCESLLGNKEEAISMLKKAVELGWKDVDHLEKDKDFDNVKEMDEFKLIVDQLKGNVSYPSVKVEDCFDDEDKQQEEEQEEVEEEKEEDEKKVDDDKKKKEDVDVSDLPFSKALEALKEMGFVNWNKNLAALVRFKGDVQKALSHLLNQPDYYDN